MGSGRSTSHDKRTWQKLVSGSSNTRLDSNGQPRQGCDDPAQLPYIGDLRVSKLGCGRLPDSRDLREVSGDVAVLPRVHGAARHLRLVGVESCVGLRTVNREKERERVRQTQSQEQLTRSAERQACMQAQGSIRSSRRRRRVDPVSHTAHPPVSITTARSHGRHRTTSDREAHTLLGNSFSEDRIG